MARIILDYSANTFKNDPKLIKRAIDEIKQVDTGRHEIIFKTQLFTKAGDNIPCTHESFKYMYEYGNSQGYKVTSSVFDKESLDFLLKFDIPFIKIANRRDLHYLICDIPRGIPVYCSTSDLETHNITGICEKTCLTYCDVWLYCISKYPAKLKDYNLDTFFNNYSDHTEGLDLFKSKHPEIWEKHLKLSDSTGLDSGSFAITPQELKEIL